MITSSQSFDILPDARVATPSSQGLDKNDAEAGTEHSFDKVLANKCEKSSDKITATNHKQKANEPTEHQNTDKPDEKLSDSPKKLPLSLENGNNSPLQVNMEDKPAVFNDSILGKNIEFKGNTKLLSSDTNIDVVSSTNTLKTTDKELELEASEDISISVADHMLQLINPLHESAESLASEHNADMSSNATPIINTLKATDKELNLKTAQTSSNGNHPNIINNIDEDILENPAVSITDNILTATNQLHEPTNQLHEPTELLTSEPNAEINDNPLVFNNMPKLTTAKTDGASLVKIIPEVTSLNQTIQAPSFDDADITEQELITEKFNIDKKIKKDFNLNQMKFSPSNISSKLMKNAAANLGANINNTSVEQLTESISVPASLGQANNDITQLAANSAQVSGIGVAKGVPTMAVPIPLDSPNWGEAVAKRIVLIATNGIKTVQLQLNPQDLGPMEVNINITKDQASINFNSQHVVVREALEANMQRLKEMFDAAGIDLVDVNVSDQSFAQQHESKFNGDSSSFSKENQFDDMGDEDAAPIDISLSTNAVDFYA